MRHPRSRGLALLGVTLAVAAAGPPLAAASGGSASSSGQTRYAKVAHLCAPPARGFASCFALRLKAASRSTPGAHPYVLAAGSKSKGPAGGLTPGDLASAYSYSPTAGGSDQTVAIVDAYDDPKAEADLGTFDSHYGLPACTSKNGCFTKVGQTGSTTSLPSPDAEWAGEISLDVETVHGVCPNCKIVLVEGDSASNSSLAAAADEAIALGADEVSNSYGSPEAEEAEQLAAYDHPGVVVVASAGDWGYYDWDNDFDGSGTASGEAESPASYPTVVAVGGTTLKLAGNGLRKSETVWNNSGVPSAQGIFSHHKQFSATGGGCSLKYAAPTWQQQAPDWSASGCEGHRLVSDVSAVADPYTGFDVYDSYGGSGWVTVGGTSLSAPLISAMYALAGGSHDVSYPAQTLYTQLGNPASLYDVTSGGNGYCEGEGAAECGEPAANERFDGQLDCLGTTACNAAPGFDGPSGVGAPVGLAAFGGPPAEVAPTVLTAKASSIETENAVLNATVDPNGTKVTACTFEYGPGTTITQSVPCSTPPGSGSSPVAVSAEIAGLSPKTAYSFRISAGSGGGTSVGKLKKLKTH